MKDNGATMWSCWASPAESIRIGLISDTHIPQVARELPEAVLEALRGVDLILHAGDIYEPSCLAALESIAPLLAVELGGAVHFERDSRVAHKQVIEVAGRSVGLVHDLRPRGLVGDLAAETLERAYSTGDAQDMALREFFGTGVDIVVFGHTHEALITAHHETLFVNPGSPTRPDPPGSPGTVAILEIRPEGAAARIVALPR